MYRKVGGTRKTAKRKHTVKRRHHRSRRISGAGDVGGMVQKAGGLIVGAIAAREINTLGTKLLPSVFSSPMISAVIQMAVGFFLPKLVKGAFFANMGDGMIANGGMVLVVSTGVISGADTMAYRIGGTSNLRVIGGTSNLKVVGNPGDNRIANIPAPIKAQTFSNFGQGY